MSSPPPKKSYLYRDLQKIIRVMRSCKHQYQFEISVKMYNNWVKLYLDTSVLDIDARVHNEMREIANKFGYDFRRNGGFIHVENLKYESPEE